jgi:putative ABC transport system substrate-binding protein
MTRARAGALTVLPTAMFFNERRRLVDLAAKNRLPTVFPHKESVDAGGLMGYGPVLADLFRRAATYVDISKHVGRVNRESIVIDAVAA